MELKLKPLFAQSFICTTVPVYKVWFLWSYFIPLLVAPHNLAAVGDCLTLLVGTSSLPIIVPWYLDKLSLCGCLMFVNALGVAGVGQLECDLRGWDEGRMSAAQHPRWPPITGDRGQCFCNVQRISAVKVCSQETTGINHLSAKHLALSLLWAKFLKCRTI